MEYPSQSTNDDLPPAQPITPHQVPELPIAPRRRPNLGAIIGIASVVVLVGAFSGLLFARNHASAPVNNDNSAQAQNILNQAAASSLRDATYTLALSQGINVANTNITTSGAGNGTVTINPYRMEMTFHFAGGLLGAGSVSAEEIVDSTGVYTNTGLSKTGKPWEKLSANTSLTGIGSGANIAPTNIFDYSQLNHLQMQGTSTIAGRKAWHLHANLSALIAADATAAAEETTTAKQFGVTSSDSEDLWFFQDNLYPAQIAFHLSTNLNEHAAGNIPVSGTINIDETMTFTAWNSGVVITVPPPSEVATITPTPTPTKGK
jgi:hypothetical protein